MVYSCVPRMISISPVGDWSTTRSRYSFAPARDSSTGIGRASNETKAMHAEIEAVRVVQHEVALGHGVIITATPTRTWSEMSRRRLSCVVFVVCVAHGLYGSAQAQPHYPTRTVSIVVPFTPGTGADVIARLLQPRLAERLKVAVVVENKVGASGAIGTETVAKSAPDGYTLLFTATAHATVPALKRNLPYDPTKSFTPVALAATSALALVTGPQVPAAKLSDFIALARSKPGALYYSSPGNGSPQHLTMELVKLETGIDVVHVPYKGSAGAASDRDPARYFMPRNLAPELVTEDDILEYDLDSNPIDAQGRALYHERFIHGEIYKARPDVMAVVHNHSHAVVPYSCTNVALQPIFHMAAFVGLGVPTWDIRDAQKGTDMLVRTPYLGEHLAKGLGRHPAVLMRGHGSTVVAENLPRAVGRAVYLDINARMQSQAIALAGDERPIVFMDDAEVQANVSWQNYERSWSLWKTRVLARLAQETAKAR